MGNIIKVTSDLEITAIECPKNANYRFLQEQIGGHIERVRPRRLYPLLKACGLDGNHCLLVDDEGLLKDLPFNPLGCYLYGTDMHGAPIAGPILFVYETGEDFGAIPGDELESLLNLVKQLVKRL